MHVTAGVFWSVAAVSTFLTDFEHTYEVLSPVEGEPQHAFSFHTGDLSVPIKKEHARMSVYKIYGWIDRLEWEREKERSLGAEA